MTNQRPFRCSVCHARSLDPSCGILRQCVPTGRVRAGSPRDRQTRYEYRCSDCGHVGVTQNEAFAERCHAMGVLPHPLDVAGQLAFRQRNPPHGERIALLRCRAAVDDLLSATEQARRCPGHRTELAAERARGALVLAMAEVFEELGLVHVAAEARAEHEQFDGRHMEADDDRPASSRSPTDEVRP